MLMASPKGICAVLALSGAVANARMQGRLQADGAVGVDGAETTGAATSILVTPPAKIDHSLTICNAYSSSEPMSVVQHNPDTLPTLLTSTPIPYKNCREMDSPMSDGAELEFRFGNAAVGEFTASEVPRQATSLLLVASRKRSGYKSIQFDSHAFADSDLAQVAVIDAYRGSGATAQMEISRHPSGPAENDKKSLLQQAMEYGSISYLNPGDYTVRLGNQNQIANLPAQKGKTYVLLHVGSDQEGPAFPEELVLYSGAAAIRVLMGLALALLAYW
jgi:hypothetical protein